MSKFRQGWDIAFISLYVNVLFKVIRRAYNKNMSFRKQIVQE